MLHVLSLTSLRLLCFFPFALVFALVFAFALQRTAARFASPDLVGSSLCCVSVVLATNNNPLLWISPSLSCDPRLALALHRYTSTLLNTANASYFRIHNTRISYVPLCSTSLTLRQSSTRSRGIWAHYIPPATLPSFLISGTLWILFRLLCTLYFLSLISYPLSYFLSHPRLFFSFLSFSHFAHFACHHYTFYRRQRLPFTHFCNTRFFSLLLLF